MRVRGGRNSAHADRVIVGCTDSSVDGMQLIIKLTLIVALSVLPSVVGGAVHEVGDGESIAAALARAEAGDTIRLVGTQYHENIVIEVPVKLTGVGFPEEVRRDTIA